MVKLTDAEQEYIKLNYKSVSVPKMAEHLKRGAASLYPYMHEKGYKPCVKIESRGYNHPLRAQNRKLEQYHIARRSSQTDETS